jgi:zinc/manganese transport system permease protein
MDFLGLMILPFLACLILTGIHAYLGIHVLDRGVIFVDLALAQIAALGATVAFLFGYELHSTAGYFFSLTFALAGAVFFAFLRDREGTIPQEAFIGVLYAVSSAACVLVLSSSADGGEELKSLLVGHLLLIDLTELITVSIIYSLLGVFHWWYRERFTLLSHDPDTLEIQGRSIRLWDLLFYGTFAVVITSSVELAGVLLVFSFLVVPAVCGRLFFSRIRERLLFGWMIGGAASICGILASYKLDLPTGATIVVSLGIIALASLIVHTIFFRSGVSYSARIKGVGY